MIANFNNMYHETPDKKSMRTDFHIHTGPYKIEHTHGYWEIMVVTDSECINVINGEEQNLGKYEVQIIRPNDRHKILKYSDKIHTHINIEVRSEVLKDLVRNCYSENFFTELSARPKLGSFVYGDEDLVYIEKLLHRVQLCGDEFDKWEQYLRQILARLVLLAVDQKMGVLNPNGRVEDEDASKSAQTVKNVLSLMRKKENFDKKITDFCEMRGISEKHLGRLFREQGKETPGKEFKNIKYDYACGLLLTTSLTVSEIMEEISVWDIGHFNKNFYERYKMTPGAFREKHKKKS